jgi:UPF0271 protein
MKTIDLNCDLGEGMASDERIMSFISSCNIACGGHFGDEKSVEIALQLALKYGVKAGAHPSFRDQENFGRMFIDVSRCRFRESITQQIQLFQKIAKQVGVALHHIKMHGALYHAAAYREDFSDWLVELMLEAYPDILLYVPPNSLLEKKCKAHRIDYRREGFADRSYDANGKLVERSQPNALIKDYRITAAQIEMLVKNQKIRTPSGIEITLEIDTICIHGDNTELMKDFEKLVVDLKSKGIKIG